MRQVRRQGRNKGSRETFNSQLMRNKCLTVWLTESGSFWQQLIINQKWDVLFQGAQLSLSSSPVLFHHCGVLMTMMHFSSLQTHPVWLFYYHSRCHSPCKISCIVSCIDLNAACCWPSCFFLFDIGIKTCSERRHFQFVNAKYCNADLLMTCI